MEADQATDVFGQNTFYTEEFCVTLSLSALVERTIVPSPSDYLSTKWPHIRSSKKRFIMGNDCFVCK
jgi:hypothetical protein